MFERVYGIKGKGDMIVFNDLKKVLVGKIWDNKFEEGSDVFDLFMKLPNTVEDPSDRQLHKIWR